MTMMARFSEKMHGPCNPVVRAETLTHTLIFASSLHDEFSRYKSDSDMASFQPD